LTAYIQERAGLLIDRGKGTYTFPHRSYQEYLAGSYLAVQPRFPDETADLVGGNYVQWREVALWAVGVMARLKKMTHIAVDVAAALCPRDAPDGAVADRDWRMAYLAGEALLEIGLKEVQTRERHRLVLARVRRWLAALLEQGALAPVERAAAGQTLARLDDPRPGVGPTPDGLPDIVWSRVVPAGEFIMGSDEGDDDEKPAHKLTLPAFQISKYPITNAQFAAFVQDGGYTRKWRRCWTDAGWAWKGNRAEPDKRGGVYDLPNHPVVYVRWYEALAFCRWLSEKLGCAITLPTEAQWEKAARHVPGTPTAKAARHVPGTSHVPGTLTRAYPWGDDITPDHANFDATGIGTTSAVGIFPRGASPCGALDMSGNVWEWCLTKWRDNYQTAADDDPEGDAGRVLRGGAYWRDRTFVRCACRHGLIPAPWSDDLGFRVARSSP
jgi:formylglycine-generating enzyme required for sulfatase activity